jgi:hypothetical protein
MGSYILHRSLAYMQKPHGVKGERPGSRLSSSKSASGRAPLSGPTVRRTAVALVWLRSLLKSQQSNCVRRGSTRSQFLFTMRRKGKATEQQPQKLAGMRGDSTH